MITHGTQEITDLRRGTWQITSMTRGTFDILGTFTTPYSFRATAALQAAFSTTQWETILQYGFAHPEIVGYMNAYAVEDPKIAYSLVEGIGTRWLLNSGSAYAIMPEKAETFPLIIEGVWRMHTLSGERDYFGNWNSGGFEIGHYNGGLGMYANSWWTPHTIQTETTYQVRVECTETKKTQTVNGDYKETTTNNRITSTAYPGLMAGRDNGYSTTNMDAQWFKITMNGRNYWLVPFKKPDTETIEWRDLYTGDYLQRVGTFTELIDSPA